MDSDGHGGGSVPFRHPRFVRFRWHAWQCMAMGTEGISESRKMSSRVTGKVLAVLTFSTAALRLTISLADFFSAVRTAAPAARPAHSFLKFRAYSLNVLSSRFRFLDGDNPADPLIASEWRNVLPFCPRHGVGNENLSQIRPYAVYRSRREHFLVHGVSYHANVQAIGISGRWHDLSFSRQSVLRPYPGYRVVLFAFRS